MEIEKTHGLPPESLEKIIGILDEMREDNNSVPILVEGRRDRRALVALGFKGEIIVLNSGKSLSNLADKIASSYGELIILTDWDKKGSYLAGRIFNLLRDNDVVCNLEYRRKLGFYLGSHISTVEELSFLSSEKII